jgi:hypothetical protein
LAVLRFAVDFYAAEPLRFMPADLVLELRLAVALLAVERFAVVLFLAVARFAVDFEADLDADFAVERPADFFAAERDAVLRAPVERVEPERVLELFVEAALRAPLRPPVDFADEAFFVAAIGTPPELEWSAPRPPDGPGAKRPQAGALCGVRHAATRPPRGS